MNPTRAARDAGRNLSGAAAFLALMRAWWVIGILVSGVSVEASAQAWIRDPGSVYAKLGYRVIRAERLYGVDGETVPIERYRQHTVEFHGEAGVVDRWLMLTAGGELLRRNVLVDQGAVTGLGDLRVGAWTGLVEAPFRLALGVRVGLPTGDPDPDASDGADVIADALPTGDGEVDVGLHLAVGHGFGWRRVQQYVAGDVGYVLRTTPRDAPGALQPADFRDQLAWRAEIGLRVDRPFIERFWFVLRLSGLVVVQDRGADANGPPRFAGLGDGVDYTAVGLETSVRLGAGLSVSFGANGAFAAKNVPAAAAWTLALSYER